MSSATSAPVARPPTGSIMKARIVYGALAEDGVLQRLRAVAGVALARVVRRQTIGERRGRLGHRLEHRAERGVLVRVTRQRERPHGAAVIARLARDDLAPLRLALRERHLAAELHRALGRLAAAGDEEGPVEARSGEFGQEIGKLNVRLALEHAGEREGAGLGLLRHRLQHPLVAAAEVVGDGPGRHVGVALARLVPEIDPLPRTTRGRRGVPGAARNTWMGPPRGVAPSRAALVSADMGALVS